MEAIQDQLLTKRMDTMRQELVKSGWPEDVLTDEALSARILLHQGNTQAALTAMVNERSSLLKGFVQANTAKPGELELPNGTPPVPGRREAQDSWGKARAGATQRLRMANRAEAQQQ
jgi:hypothetical protein